MTDNMDSVQTNWRAGRPVATAALIGSAACWGFATVMSRDLLNSMAPLTLLVIQLAGSVTLLLLLAAADLPRHIKRRNIGLAAALGILEPGLAYAVGLAGLAWTTAGEASVISASEPILIVLMSWLLFRHRPSKRFLVCIALAVAGVLMITGSSYAEMGRSQLLGNLLIVLATLFAATYVVLSARIANDFPPATLALSQHIVGLGFALLLHLLMADADSVSNLPLHTIAYAALSGVVQYALAFWFYLFALRSFAASSAGLGLTLVPVFGLVGASLWLGEVPTTTMLFGALLILAAVVVGQREE